MKTLQTIFIAIILIAFTSNAAAQNAGSFNKVANKPIVFSTTQNDVRMMFQTSNEANTNCFQIERSIDGAQFETIKTVKTAANGLAKVNYELKFAKCYNTSVKVEYRVKMVFNDGSCTTSESVLFEKFIKQGLVGYGMIP
jgi:hypothetical protein